MARSVLNTTLEFGVVSVPIAVMPARSSRDVELDNASPDGNAMNQVYVDAVLGTKCERADWRKGIFRSKPDKKDRSTWGDFTEIPADAIAEIEEGAQVETFEIKEFVPLAEVPFERARGCYFIAPQHGSGGAASKPLKLLYEALKQSKRAGVVKIVIRKRQHPAVIYAKNGGLFLNTLAWAEDFAAAKEAEEVLAAAEAEPKMVAMAIDLVEALGGDGTLLDSMTDDLRPEKERLLEEALAGKPVKAKAKAKPEKKSDDLAALLEESIKQSGAKKAKTKSTKSLPAAKQKVSA